MYIVLSVTAHQEGRQWVSTCVELDIASCGDTQNEALDNILEATLLYLDSLQDLGECKQVLQEKGVKIHSGEPASMGRPLRAAERNKAEVIAPATITLPVACSA